MEAQLERAGMPSPQVIGIDEIAIRKGHTYRIVVSDLLRGRPIWFGGMDRSEGKHGRVLHQARQEQELTHPAGGDRHVEAVSAGHGSRARVGFGACGARRREKRLDHWCRDGLALVSLYSRSRHKACRTTLKAECSGV
jgi:hypothetical protein